MIYLNDMTRCAPESAVSTVRKAGRWHLLPYEADGICGTMLAAGELSDAPDVTLPLEVKGWHGIWVGFWIPSFHNAQDFVIKLKLTHERIFSRIRHKATEISWVRAQLYEAFWKYADLTDRDLVIGQLSKGKPTAAHLAYVRLDPLSVQQVQEIERDRARTDTRTVVALNDGCSFLAREGCTTEEELYEQVEPYRHSDVGRVSWAVNYGEVTNYPSRVGTFLGGIEEDPDSIDTRNVIESLRVMASRGIVPFEKVLNYVHEMGLKFHAMFRLGILTGDIMTSQCYSAFSARHPELRILHKDGTPLPKLSYAFPQVRQFMVDLMKEVGETDIDGMDLCFMRGPMYVGYEAPAVEEFKQTYGEDPHDLDEHDERWLLHKAGYVTEFLRAARNLVDEIGKKRGRRVYLSAAPYWTRSLNLYHGFDVPTWVKEGLVDGIETSLRDQDFINMLRDHDCEFIADVGARLPENYVKCALTGYDTGAAGIGIWDMNEPQDKPEHWEILRNLGHREQVQAFDRQLPVMKTIRLKTVGGLDVCHTTNRDAPEGWPPEMVTLITCG